MRQDDSNNMSRTKSVLWQSDTSQFDNLSLIDLLQAILDGADQHGLYRLALMKRTRGYTNRVVKPFLVQGSISQADLDSLQFITLCEVLDSLSNDEQVPILKHFYSLMKWRLIANIIDNIDHESNISLPSNMRLYMRKYMKFIRMYEQTHNGTKPPEDVIAKALNMSIKQIRALQQAYLTQWPEALDATIKTDDEGQDMMLADTLADGCCVEDVVTDEITLSELRAALAKELEDLPKAEQDAICKRFFDGDTIDDISIYRKAMRNLCRPERMRRLSQYTGSFYGGGWESFKVSFTSRPEAIAIRHDTRGNE